MRPSRTASAAGPASGSIRTHHCSEISGSTIVPERWQWPMAWAYGSTRSTSPFASRSATMRSRAAKRSTPAYCPASSVSVPSRAMTLITGRSWRRPMSKSTGSWPGVILSAPEPASGATASSAITGTARSEVGTSTVRPSRWR